MRGIVSRVVMIVVLGCGMSPAGAATYRVGPGRSHTSLQKVAPPLPAATWIAGYRFNGTVTGSLVRLSMTDAYAITPTPAVTVTFANPLSREVCPALLRNG